MAQQPQQQDRTQAQLASLLATGAAAASLVPAAVALLAPLGISAATVRAVLRLPDTPAESAVGLGPAGRAVRAAAATYRAAYLINAAQRVQQRLDTGQGIGAALRAEKPNLLAHLHAQANRRRAADAVDQQVRKHGTLLGWRAVMDTRTSAECAAANGRNFDVFAPPAIGWPGAVHPHCRCRPVPAFAGAGLVGEQLARKTVAA